MDKWKNAIVFMLCLVLWQCLFCSGTIVGTKIYRDQVSGHTGPIQDVWWLVWCWVIIFLNYSISNLGILCCLSSVIGGLTHSTHRERVPKLLSRGLGVYLFFVAGAIIMDTSSMVEVSQEKYIKLAIILSLFSYVIGYKPNLFEAMMNKAGKSVQDSIDSGVLPAHDPLNPPPAQVAVGVKPPVPAVKPPVLNPIPKAPVGFSHTVSEKGPAIPPPAVAPKPA